MIVLLMSCSGLTNSKNVQVSDIVLNFFFETGASPYDDSCPECTESGAGSTAMSVYFYEHDEDRWCNTNEFGSWLGCSLPNLQLSRQDEITFTRNGEVSVFQSEVGPDPAIYLELEEEISGDFSFSFTRKGEVLQHWDIHLPQPQLVSPSEGDSISEADDLVIDLSALPDNSTDDERRVNMYILCDGLIPLGYDYPTTEYVSENYGTNWVGSELHYSMEDIYSTLDLFYEGWSRDGVTVPSWRDSSFSDTCTFQVWVELLYEQSLEEGNTLLYSTEVEARSLIQNFSLDLIR